VGQGGSQVDPSRAYATWQNLSAQGLPLEVTEFGETTGADADQAASLTTAMTLAFGTPQMNGFTIWGFYATPGLFAGSLGSVLYDTNYNITAAGQAYEALRSSWNTDFTSTINADGSVTLPGTAFYGNYSVIIGGKSYPLNFVKGSTSYSLIVPTGDYNMDGKVDAADYVVWRATLGSTTDLRADGDGNGVIGASDYDAWVATFGNVYSNAPGAGSAAAVPEPTSAIFLLAGVTLMCSAATRCGHKPILETGAGSARVSNIANAVAHAPVFGGL
jgi:hypothetical protein